MIVFSLQVCLSTICNPLGINGARSPDPIATGAVSTLISSYKSSEMKPASNVGPPSTMSDVTPSFLSRSRRGTNCSLCPQSTLKGFFPAHRRTSRRGLSIRRVLAPAIMASTEALSRCIQTDETAFDNLIGEGSPLSSKAAMKPSALCAHLSSIQGRRWVWAVMNLRLISMHSLRSIPSFTSIPASRSIRMPFPATSGLGSGAPITTLGIRLEMISEAHGGVFP